MPQLGDSYIVELKEPHINWGSHRYTNSRGLVYGEGYIKIPSTVAIDFDIYSSNHPTANTIYNCHSADGFLSDVQLKASGSQGTNGLYAKQFHGNGDLKLVGRWYGDIGVHIGDRIKVEFLSPTEILLTKI